MSLVDKIKEGFDAVAEEINKRPLNIIQSAQPTNKKTTQFWTDSNTNALYQYSPTTEQYELLSANLVAGKPLDGGNF